MASDKAGPGSRSLLLGLVVALVLVAAGLTAGYLTGVLSEAVIAIVQALVFAAVLAGICLNGAFSHAEGWVRAAGIGLALAILFACMYPAREQALPGTPVAEGRLSTEYPKLALPGAGSYRLVVSSRLTADGGTVEYAIAAGPERLDGTLERVQSRRRIGRGGSAMVAEDHDSVSHEITVPAGTVLTLDSMKGRTAAGDLLVRAYAEIPATWYHLALVAMVAWALVLEFKARTRGAFTMTAVAAVCFGLLMRAASSGNTIGPVLGSALLASGGGALGGSLLNLILDRFRRPPAMPTKPRKD